MITMVIMATVILMRMSVVSMIILIATMMVMTMWKPQR